MGTEGARLYIQPNLSGKRTEETFHRQGVFVLCFLFGAAGLSAVPFFIYDQRNIKKESIPKEWNAEKRELCKH